MMDVAAAPTSPSILAERVDGNRFELDLHLQPDLFYFRGHFDHFPVLPGVVQLHWAMQFARERFDLTGRFPTGIAVKFRSLLRPNEAPTLALEYAGTKLVFAYRVGDALRSSGQVTFSE